jgi:integrase
MAIEWYAEPPNGSIIDDLVAWRQTVEALDNPIHTAFYQFLLFTGLRKSEALKLEWKDIHEDRLHLPITKNGRSFDLPILQTHHGILAPLKGTSGEDMNSGQRRTWSVIGGTSSGRKGTTHGLPRLEPKPFSPARFAALALQGPRDVDDRFL